MKIKSRWSRFGEEIRHLGHINSYYGKINIHVVSKNFVNEVMGTSSELMDLLECILWRNRVTEVNTDK